MENKETETEKGEQTNTTQNKLFWIIGCVILLIIGWFSWRLIFGSEDYKVSLVNAPSETVSGGVTTFTWRIDGPSATTNHTAVYYSTISDPGVFDKTVKPQDTKYTDFVRDFSNGKYNIPLQFIGNTTIKNPGKYYFRIYAVIKDKNYWSDEYTLEVKPAGDYKIMVVNIPKDLTAGSMATFTWDISGVATILNQTTIYYGEESTPGKLDVTVRPADTKYTEYFKDFVKGKYNIPYRFVGNEKIAIPGSYFYRGYAEINGKHYWTDEGTFEVK
jgi:hypothetical protein